MMFHLLVAALMLLSAASSADGLSPEQVARIQADEQKAMEKVNAAHGNKKASEMDRDERRQLADEQRKANQEVLDQHGVSAKDYARASSTMSREERSRQEAESKSIQAADKAKAAAPAKVDQGGVVIEYKKKPPKGAQADGAHEGEGENEGGALDKLVPKSAKKGGKKSSKKRSAE